MCWSKVNVCNNHDNEKNIPYHASLKKNDIKFIGLYIKNSNFLIIC